MRTPTKALAAKRRRQGEYRGACDELAKASEAVLTLVDQLGVALDRRKVARERYDKAWNKWKVYDQSLVRQ